MKIFSGFLQLLKQLARPGITKTKHKTDKVEWDSYILDTARMLGRVTNPEKWQLNGLKLTGVYDYKDDYNSKSLCKKAKASARGGRV